MRGLPGVALTCLLCLCAAPALAWMHAFDDEGITGRLWSEKDLLAAETVMVVDRTPRQVLAVLLDYERIGRWLPDTLDYRVVQRQGRTARFYRKVNTPFFAQDMWVTLDGSVTVETPELTRVEWHRVGGTIMQFDASWELAPHPMGTQVTYRVKTPAPSLAPQFILERVGPRAIVKTMLSLRKEVERSPKQAK